MRPLQSPLECERFLLKVFFDTIGIFVCECVSECIILTRTSLHFVDTS